MIATKQVQRFRTSHGAYRAAGDDHRSRLERDPHATVGAIRSWRERLIQALCFEALGLAIVSPVFAYVVGASTGESLIVLSVLSLAVMCWAVLYNTAFDLIEYRCIGRLASDRPHGLRALHSLALEVTAALVTWPLIVALTPLDWPAALVADIGLTLAYALYGYVFHLGFDRLRPVRSDESGDRCSLAVLSGGAGQATATGRTGAHQAATSSSNRSWLSSGA